MLAANLALALAPSLILLGWAYRRDTVRKESVRLLAAAFFLGLLAVAPALFVGLLASAFGTLLGNDYLAPLYEAFVVAALVEEGVKFLLLLVLFRRHPQFDEYSDGIVYGMAVSLGFAFLENVLYVTGPTEVLLLRGVTAVPLHAGCGAIIGYFVAKSVLTERTRAVPGLLIAVVLHGVYDALLFTRSWISFAALGVIVGLAVAVPLLFRHAIRLDTGRQGT